MFFPNVKSAIPSEQEIIYSTDAEIRYVGPICAYESDARELARRGEKQYEVEWWDTELLITSKGLAFEVHYKFGDAIEVHYFPLYLCKFTYEYFYVTIPDKRLLSAHEVSLIEESEFKKLIQFLTPYFLTEITEMLKDLSYYIEKNPDYTYSEYLTTHKYPFAEFNFRVMRDHLKEGESIELYIERFYSRHF